MDESSHCSDSRPGPEDGSEKDNFHFDSTRQVVSLQRRKRNKWCLEGRCTLFKIMWVRLLF